MKTLFPVYVNTCTSPCWTGVQAGILFQSFNFVNLPILIKFYQSSKNEKLLSPLAETNAMNPSLFLAQR